MKYRVHSIGEGVDREASEILCGENTALKYVGKGNSLVLKITDRGVETPEKDLDEI